MYLATGITGRCKAERRGRLLAKYGNAISFNGTNAYVNVPNSSSVQLTTAMTLEAWVNPSQRKGVWRDVIYKGNDNYYLEADSTSGKPATGGSTFGGPLFGTAALTTNTWTHFAGTYDGMTLRLYVNGTQVSQPCADRANRDLDECLCRLAVTVFTVNIFRGR